MSHSPSRRSFLSGVSVLTLSALVVKVIGLLYRIPLLNYLGTEGMGYFNTAYELYALFCILSTAGLPVAMSVLISAHEAEGRHGVARRVYRVALLVFLAIGVVGTLALGGLAHQFSSLLGNDRAAACMRAVAPTVLFICLSSAFRGYFQGHRNMVPTAVSQVMEAAGKLVLGLLFASHARATGKDLPTTAAYAVLGLTVGTALSVLYLALHKYVTDRRSPATLANPADAGTPSTRGILRALATTAIPVTLSAGVISLTKCVDVALILRRLQATGYTAAEANALYGCYSTLAVPVFNVLPSLCTSVAMSAVPALSAALQKGEEGQRDVRRIATSSLGMTLMISVPAALGLAVFAGDVLSLLFAGQPAAVAEATPYLACLGLSVPAACLVTVTGAMLQASGHAGRPIVSILAGVAVKIILAYILLGTESVGMMGAPISSVICDTVIVAVNLLHIARVSPAMIPRGRTAVGLFSLPLLGASVSVGAVRLLRVGLGWQSVTPLHTLGTVTVVVCIYGACALLFLLLRGRRKMGEEAGSEKN